MAFNPLPAKYPLILYRGDTRTWDYAFSRDGEPLDLTGYTIAAQIRASGDDTEVLAALDIDVIDAAAGQVRMVLTAEQSAKLIPPRASWDLQLVGADGFTRTFLAGPVKIVADVTRGLV